MSYSSALHSGACVNESQPCGVFCESVSSKTLLKSLLILTIQVTKQRLMFSFSISQAPLKAGDIAFALFQPRVTVWGQRQSGPVGKASWKRRNGNRLHPNSLGAIQARLKQPECKHELPTKTKNHRKTTANSVRGDRKQHRKKTGNSVRKQQEIVA